MILLIITQLPPGSLNTDIIPLGLVGMVPVFCVFRRKIIMAWIELLIAGILETVWATTLKLSQGFHKTDFAIYTIVAMVGSFWLLARAIRSLPLGLAYPVWTGIGAVGTIIVGVVFFGDKLSPLTWGFVVLLLIGIVGIKLTV